MYNVSQMKRMKRIVIGLFCLLPFHTLCAQIGREVFTTSAVLENDSKGKLLLDVDNLNFFQNNEFKTVTDGYSLPGLWIQPKLTFYPLANLKLEAGMHMLYYSGAWHYPIGKYINLPEKDKDSGNKNIHMRPFFRAHLASNDRMFHLVLGNLYGGSAHNLMEALYNPELNLTADPESGLQMLLKSDYCDADVWLDWQNFIFRNDNHREQFILGLSSMLKFNAPQKTLHWYMPIQIVAQHIGGEIQAEPYHGISSLANVGIGIGVKWNTPFSILKNVQAESDFVGYKQLAGTLLPIDNGYGWHNAISARFADFYVKLGHMNSRKFVSIMGSPFFGSLSDFTEPTIFSHSQMLYGKVEYNKRLKQVGSLGISLTLYQYFPGEGTGSDGSKTEVRPSASIQAGIYLRITPSLFLHKF